MAKNTQELEALVDKLQKQQDEFAKSTETRLAQLSGQVDDHAGKIEGITGDAESHAKAIDGLKSDVSETGAKVGETAKMVAEHRTALIEVGKVLKNSKPADNAPKEIKKEEPLKVPDGTFEVGGVKAKFLFTKVRDLNGTVIPSAVVLENQEEYAALLKKLVESKSGLIKIIK